MKGDTIMKVEISLASKHNAYSATATYEEGKVFVHAGGFIQMDFAKHIHGGRKARSFRENPDYVNSEGQIVADCVFTSPSTAAQFVTGRSCNGYESWKVAPKKTLGKYLSENGIR